MNENILNTPPHPREGIEDYYLYIDFEDQEVDSQELIDKSGNFEFTKTIIDPNAAEDGVIVHEELGKCYNFTKKHYFSANKIPDLLNKDFILEIDFIDKDILSQQAIFETGFYPSAGPRAGFSVFLNDRTGNQSIQLFNMHNNSGWYSRQYWPLTNAGQRLQLSFLQSEQSILSERITGLSSNHARFHYDAFSYLDIGGNRWYPYHPASMYLKSIKLRIID